MSQDSTENTALLKGEKGQPPAYGNLPPYPRGQNPPAPQTGYPAAGTVTVVTQPVVIQPVIFGDYPVFIVDSEGRQVQTVLQYRASALTHLLCFVLFIIGLLIFLPALFFCWVPYIVNSTKDVYHINPIDGTVMGVYKRM